MNAAEKSKRFPGAYADYQALVAKKEAVLAQTKPLRKQYAALMEQIHALEAQAKPIREAMRTLETEQLVDIDNGLSTLDRAMGGGRLNNAA